MSADASTPAAAPRVLIVEDSETQVRLLRRVLTKAGYVCHAVADGAAAFDACVDLDPAVILLDVQLPGLDGLTVCRRLKQAPETRLTPVLIMTGRADHHEYLAALDAGADDFLSKPIVFAELVARVRSAVRLTHYIDELDDVAASVVMLGATIEARDRSTNGHCQRVASSASRLGVRIGMDRDDLRALDRGGYLHDLGKIAIPDAVLLKPGPLTPAEYALIKTHPAVGERLCLSLKALHRECPIIRSHHETLDGKGYPDGLAGSAVPLLAQVTTLADVFDALTSDRPYRRALPVTVGYETLTRGAADGRYDSALVNEFIALSEARIGQTLGVGPGGDRPDDDRDTELARPLRSGANWRLRSQLPPPGHEVAAEIA